MGPEYTDTFSSFRELRTLQPVVSTSTYAVFSVYNKTEERIFRNQILKEERKYEFFTSHINDVQTKSNLRTL